MSNFLRTMTASQLGCVLDCNLQTGLTFAGGAATDNTAIINAFLATASASNPIRLIMDGGTLSSGIQIAPGGHTIIEGLGWDTGFYQKSGANADVINNIGAKYAFPFDPGPTAPTITASNVVLRNFFVNGNRGNGTTGNSTSGNPLGVVGAFFFVGVNLVSISNLRIEDVWLYDVSAYAMRLSNVAEVVVDGCRMESPSLGVSTDGVHLSGPASDVRVSNCYITSGDDAIALNCPEGYSGNISRVLVDNCDVANAGTFIRVYPTYGSNTNLIDTVLITNCYANTANVGILVGNASGAGAANCIGAVLLSNCKITTPVLANISSSMGLFALNQVEFIPSGTPNGITITGGATVTTFKVNGLTVPSGTVPFLVDAGTGCVLGALLLDSFDSRNFTALVGSSGFTQVVAIGGSAVLTSGFAVPNTAMMNCSDFMSSTSSLPSIKIAGTVKTYTVS